MRLALALAGLLVVAGSASGAPCVGSSCTLELEFTESTTYTDGQPLKDLKDHVVTYQKAGGPAETVVIAASRPQGGGTLLVTTPPQTVPPCTTATFSGSVVSRAVVAQPSQPAIAPTATIDRTNDPECAPPKGMTFQCKPTTCVLDWTAVSGASQYRVGRCATANRCPGEKPADWKTVVVTTATSVTIEPPTGRSDYAVFATLADGTSKMLPMRVTVTAPLATRR